MNHSFAGMSSTDHPWSLLSWNRNMFYAYPPNSSRKLSQSQRTDLKMLKEEKGLERIVIAVLTLFSSSVPKPPPLTQKITKPSCCGWGGYN